MKCQRQKPTRWSKSAKVPWQRLLKQPPCLVNQAVSTTVDAKCAKQVQPFGQLKKGLSFEVCIFAGLPNLAPRVTDRDLSAVRIDLRPKRILDSLGRIFFALLRLCSQCSNGGTVRRGLRTRNKRSLGWLSAPIFSHPDSTSGFLQVPRVACPKTASLFPHTSWAGPGPAAISH